MLLTLLLSAFVIDSVIPTSYNCSAYPGSLTRNTFHLFNKDVLDKITLPCGVERVTTPIKLSVLWDQSVKLKRIVSKYYDGDERSSVKEIIKKRNRSRTLKHLKSEKRFKGALQNIQYFFHVYYSYVRFLQMEDNYSEQCLCEHHNATRDKSELLLRNEILSFICVLSTCGINEIAADSLNGSSSNKNPEIDKLLLAASNVNFDDNCNKTNLRKTLKDEMLKFIESFIKVIGKLSKQSEEKKCRKGKDIKAKREKKKRKPKGRGNKRRRRKDKKQRRGKDKKRRRGKDKKRERGKDKKKRRRKHKGAPSDPLSATTRKHNKRVTTYPVTTTSRKHNKHVTTDPVTTTSRKQSKRVTTDPVTTVTTRTVVFQTVRGTIGGRLEETTIGSVTKKSRGPKRRRKGRKRKNRKRNKT